MNRLTHAQCRSLSQLYRMPWDRQYAYWKLRTDPLYPAVTAPLLDADDGETPLLDIGCGLGLFAFYLRTAGFKAPIQGLDYDHRKIAVAKKAAGAFERIQFDTQDAREAFPDFSGHITILDVLQYLTSEQQRELLTGACDALAPESRFIIRSGLRDHSWRFRVTRLGDWFAKLCFWMKDGPVAYPDRLQLQAHLEDAGLEGSVTPMWGKTPFNNYLIAYTKR